MKEYEIFGARLLVRRLQDEPAGGFHKTEFSKGRVVTVGKPLPAYEAGQDDADDPLSSSVVGGDDSKPDRIGDFRAMMREVVGVVAKMQIAGGSVMPPVAGGDVVIFATVRATLIPGESDLFVVSGDGIVARVTSSDFEGQRNG